MSEVPEVRIQYSWTLTNATVQQAMSAKSVEGDPPSPERTEARAEEYREAWRPVGEKIVSAIQDQTGLEFRQNYIDVYVVPYLRAFSDPIAIGTHYDPDFTIDAITHELIHRILVDSTSVEYQTCPDWEEVFDTEPSVHVRIHIAVHAIHKAIYLDCLQEPERLERDLANCRKYNAVDYLKAWEYVEEHGYKEIIERIKQAYIDLAASQSK